MKHHVHHHLSHDLARLATQKALDDYKRRFPEVKPEGRWIDADTAACRFTVGGKTLEAHLKVRPHDIELEMDVPLLFKPFVGPALQVIEQEIRDWIHKAEQGKLHE